MRQFKSLLWAYVTRSLLILSICTFAGVGPTAAFAQQGSTDTIPPTVFPPRSITISHTEAGGARPQDSQQLRDFLAGGKARDNLDPNPQRLTPQVGGVDVASNTLFLEGTTAVTFRFQDASGNVGQATANLTVLDLEDGDLFVGGKVADNGFGDIAVAGIYRVRGVQATVYCQSGSNADNWSLPTHVMVDSEGRVVFIAALIDGNTGLLRCSSLGAAPEKLAVFRHPVSYVYGQTNVPGIDPTPGYPDPFPTSSFQEFNGLHLETTDQVLINDDQQSGNPQISAGDSYVLSYSAPGLNSDPAGSLRYFPDSNQWLPGPSVGDVGHAQGEGGAPDMAFHAGATYVVNGGKLLRDKNGLNLSISGHAGGLSFNATLNVFGGTSELSQQLLTEPICGECGLPVHDLNAAQIDSGCNPNPPASSVLATGVFTGGLVTYDEYTGHGLVVGTGETGSGAPFLANLSEALLDKPGDPSQTFTNPGLGCAAEPEVYFTSVLPFFGQFGINGFSPLVSAPQGIVGVTGNGIALMAPGPSPVDEAFLINNQPWIFGAGLHSGLGAWPPRVSSGMSANVIIRIDSPVNVLLTGPDGKRIGVDANGQAVNDYGSDGFDSGAGEPRFFAINNPLPGAYSMQLIGTGNGPFAVHVYSNDLTVDAGSQVVTTGTASVGSSNTVALTLKQDGTVTMQSPCAVDATSAVAITRGGLRYNFSTARFAQGITITNPGTSAISGPVSLVLDNLSSNASLYSPAGSTGCAAPQSSPYITISAGNLAPGASASATLQFTDPTKSAITYNTRVLAGAGTR